MDATITLYVLGGCVALAAVVFIVMGTVTAVRAPQLPALRSYEMPMHLVRPVTPLPFAAPQASRAAQPTFAASETAPTLVRDRPPPTVIPLPPVVGVAPATIARATVSPTVQLRPLAPLRNPNAISAPRAAAAPAVTPVVRPYAGAWPAQDHGFGHDRSSRVAAGTTPPPAIMPVDRSHAGAWQPPSPPEVAPVARSQAGAWPPSPAQHRGVALNGPTRVAAGSTPPPVAPVWRPHAGAWSPAPVANVASPPVMLAPRAHVGPRLPRERHSMPVLPYRGPGKLRTFVGGFIAVLMLAAAPAVVEPTLLDPLCDDYEWDGAEAAAIARDYAREAHVAIEL